MTWEVVGHSLSLLVESPCQANMFEKISLIESRCSLRPATVALGHCSPRTRDGEMSLPQINSGDKANKTEALALCYKGFSRVQEENY